MWILLNGEMIAAEDARVSIFDRGYMYGDGVFETMRAYGGRVFRLGAHLARLNGSAEALRFRLPVALDKIGADIRAVLERNGMEDAVIRVSVSRGRGPRGPGIAGVADPTYAVVPGPLSEDFGERQVEGIRLAVVGIRRIPPDAIPAHAKHANYLNSILAHAEAADSGADDALLLDHRANLAECAAANIFLVRRGVVRTPDLGSGILPGVTRAVVLELSAGAGIEHQEERIGRAELDTADEIFTTNSVSGIVPVGSVDGRSCPADRPVTRRLQELYRQAVAEECSVSV